MQLIPLLYFEIKQCVNKTYASNTKKYLTLKIFLLPCILMAHKRRSSRPGRVPVIGSPNNSTKFNNGKGIPPERKSRMSFPFGTHQDRFQRGSVAFS